MKLVVRAHKLTKRVTLMATAFVLAVSGAVSAVPYIVSETVAAASEPVCIVGGACYATISAAVSAASDGDTITVAAGTYNESVVINKQLTIKGAKTGVDPRPSVGSARSAGGVGESVVVGSSSHAFSIKADNVTIDGFSATVTGAGTDAIKASSTQTNVTVTNNIVYNATDEGIQLEGGTNYTVSNNYVLNPVGDGITLSTYAIYKGENMVISNNDISGSTSEHGSIYLYGTQYVTISGNVIDTRSAGIALGTVYEPVRNITIKNNTINTELYTAYSALATGIGVDGNSANILIQNNNLTQIGSVYDSRENAYPERFSLIHVGVVSASQPTGVVVENNNLSKILERNYIYVNPSVTEQVTATNNWWGDTTDPSAKISGNASYSPWLCGTWETNPSVSTPNGVCSSAPDVPTITYTELPSGDSKSTGDTTQRKDFKFNLSSDATTVRYQLRYWNDIDGSRWTKDKPWNPTDSSWSGHMKSLGVYEDEFTQGEGTHYFSFSACNASGECSEYSEPFKIFYDELPSVPQLISPENNTITNNSSFTNIWKKVDGAAYYEYSTTYVKSGETTTRTYNDTSKSSSKYSEDSNYVYRTNRNSPDATYTWKVRAVDSQGNKSDWSEPFMVTVDTKAPTATITYSTTSLTRGSVVATLTTEAGAKVTSEGWTETTAGSGVFTKNYAANTNSSIPNHNETVKFEDIAGNMATANIYINWQDNKKPTVSISDVVVDNTSKTLTFKVSANDEGVAGLSVVGANVYDESVKQIRIERGRLVSLGVGSRTGMSTFDQTVSFDISTLDSGVYTIKVAARDSVNKSDNVYATYQFTVNNDVTNNDETGGADGEPGNTTPKNDETTTGSVETTTPLNLQPAAIAAITPFTTIVGTTTVNGGANNATSSGANTDAAVEGATDTKTTDTTKTNQDADEAVLGETDTKTWSLVNAVITVVIAITGVVALIGALSKKDGNKHVVARVISGVLAVAAVVVFLVVEHIPSTMVWVNNWTLLMAVLAVAQIITFSQIKKEDE